MIIIGLALIFAFYEKKEEFKLSKVQEEVENQVGEGIITFKDLNTNLLTTVDFQDKKGRQGGLCITVSMKKEFITRIINKK